MHEALIVEAMPKAKGVALAFARRFRRWVDRDDCISLAYIALVDAAQRYEKARGAVLLKFWTFAKGRVRGALLDHLRSHHGITASRARLGVELLPIGEHIPGIVSMRFVDMRPLAAALGALPARDRAWIVRYTQAVTEQGYGLSDQIHREFGISRANWQLYHKPRILRALRRELAMRGVTKVSDCL